MSAHAVSSSPDRAEDLSRLTIAVCAKECRDSLHNSFGLLNAYRDGGVGWSTLRDLLGRFNIWTSNMGVFSALHASLDYRLRDLADVKELILEHLRNMMSRSDQMIHLLVDIERASINDAENADCQSEAKPDQHNEVDTILSSISTSIDWLHRLANMIRRASTSRQNEKASAFPLKDEGGADATPELKKLFRHWIKRDFPTTADDFCERLISTMLLRRRRILYRRSRQSKLALRTAEPVRKPVLLTAPSAFPGLEEKDEVPRQMIETQAVAIPAPSGVASTQQTATTIAPQTYLQVKSTPSRVSGAKTIAMTSGAEEMIPPPPPLAENALEFICPFCSLILPAKAARNRGRGDEWAVHVKKDLDPYVCHFFPCTRDGDMFSTSADWISHMQQTHCMRWFCTTKTHRPESFASMEDYIAHMTTKHPGKFKDTQLPFLAANAQRSLKRIFKECPLCGEENIKKGESFENHVAHHLQYLALLSLPPPEDVYDAASVASTPSTASHVQEGDERISASRTTRKSEWHLMAPATFPEGDEHLWGTARPADDEIPDIGEHGQTIISQTWQMICASKLGLPSMNQPVTKEEQLSDKTLARFVVHFESRQTSSQMGPWARAADSLDPGDRQKLDNIVRRIQESSGYKERSLAEIVDSTLSKAERLREESKEATWRPVVDEIIKGAWAFKFVKFIDDTEPRYTSLGWSLVSLSLHVAADTKGAREVILSSSEVIVGFLVKYRQYEKHLRDLEAGEDFDCPLMNVYRAILLYMIAWYNYLYQSGLARIGHAIYEREYPSIKSRKNAIDTADAEMTRWILIMSKKSLDGNLSQIRSGLQHLNLPEVPVPVQECLNSLPFAEMEYRFDAIKEGAEGTCKWLLRHETYRGWANGSRGLLCIKGKPGSGKSTLLRYAISNVLSASEIRDQSLFLRKEAPLGNAESSGAQGEPGAVVLSFFFWRLGTELQRTRLGLFRSLLHQILRHIPNAMPDDLLATFQDRKDKMGDPGERWHWDWRELQDFFRSSLRNALENRSVYLFIDALDECEDENANDLIENFHMWLQERPSPSQLRICFTCRHYPPLILPHPTSEIWVEHENKDGISTYVQFHLPVESSLESEQLAVIRTEITDRASGVFLWAYLAVRQVLSLERDGKDWTMARQRLVHQAPHMDQLYGRLLEEVEDKPNSLKLFQWMCFSMEPLTLDELRWAMIVEPDLSHSPNSLQYHEARRPFGSDLGRHSTEEDLIRLSCGFAEVRPSSRAVHFIHLSAKDFFLRKGLSFLQATAVNKINEAELEVIADYQLSRACIRYFSADEIMKSTLSGSELISNFPLLRYATIHWIRHVQRSEQDITYASDLLSYFSWPSEATVQLWTKLYLSLAQNGSLDSPREGTTMLHIVSKYRLMGPLREILSHMDLLERGIDATDDQNSTPLFLAVDQGHEDVVRLLLDRGAHPAAGGSDSGHALYRASVLDNFETAIEIARMLLEKGADPNAKGAFYGGALQMASLHGSPRLARLLLEHSADVNAWTGEYGTALIAASWQGRQRTARLLLGHGADANAQSGEYGTALIAASINGHTRVAGHLLDYGADVNAQDGVGRCALAGAAAGGNRNKGIVRMLLEKGADVNARSREYGCALIAAVRAGTEKEVIVQMLLEQGADPNAQGGEDDQRSALQMAIHGGDQQIVDLLRRYGAV